MIYSGTLTERLTFYHIVESQSQSGFKKVEEVQYKSCLGDRLKNKETYVTDANELFHITELQFKIRYFEGLLDTDIVVYQGERYRILSVDKNRRENEITMTISKINE